MNFVTARDLEWAGKRPNRVLAILSLIAIPLSYGEEAPVALRLHLKPRQAFAGTLRVEREDPKTVGVLRERIEVRKSESGAFILDTTLTGLTIDGKDRSTELKAMLRNPTASLGWTELSQRTEPFVGLGLGATNPELASFVYEAGLYMGSFVSRAVQVGDTWRGSTTATGGCTSGVFTLKNLQRSKGRTLAQLEVTEIAMVQHRQLGAMRMSIDVATGLPLIVDYRVAHRKTGRESRFVQTFEVN